MFMYLCYDPLLGTLKMKLQLTENFIQEQNNSAKS